MDDRTRRRLSIAVAVIGFIILVINAADYLTGYNALSGGNTAIGLMLVIMGMYMSKNKK